MMDPGTAGISPEDSEPCMRGLCFPVAEFGCPSCSSAVESKAGAIQRDDATATALALVLVQV